MKHDARVCFDDLFVQRENAGMIIFFNMICVMYHFAAGAFIRVRAEGPDQHCRA
jgi:hypothetical protein